MARLTFAQILAAVAGQAGLSVAYLRGPSARGTSCKNWPRQRALMIARRVIPGTSWRVLAREMNGRAVRDVFDQANSAEARYARSPVERAIVAQVLARLGLKDLPPYDARQWMRARLGARFRIKISTLGDDAYADPLLDTGWQWVFPSLYDPEDLEFGIENFWSGTVTEGELDLFQRHLWAPFAEVLAERIRVEFDDQENPAGFFDLGGAFAVRGFSPEINFDRGRDLTVTARDLVEEAPSGRRFAEERPPLRELSISYSNLEDPEARRFVDAAMRTRTTRTVVFVPNLDDPAALMREAFPATFSKLPGARFGWPGLAVSNFILREILA